MTIFRGYLLIIRRNIVSILMYVVIFIAVAAMVQASYSDSQMAAGFTAARMNVAVIDRDGTELSRALQTLMEREQTLVELEDSAQVLQESLYYQYVDYVLIVPEGAQAALADDIHGNAGYSGVPDTPGGENAGGGDTVRVVEGIIAPGTATSYFLEAQITMFLNQVHTYLASGADMETACARALSLGETKAEITLVDLNGNQGSRTDYNYYMRYMPYAFLGAVIMAISTVLMEFRRKEIRQRMEACAVSLSSQNFSAVAAFLLIGAAIWAGCILIQAVLYGGGIFTGPNAGWYLLNAFVCMVVAVALGYLTGMCVKGSGALNGMCNVLVLGLCFLGGVFVPQSMLGNVKLVAQFLPTWWYIVINDILGDYSDISGSILVEIWKGLIIQAVFALACFGIALAIRKLRLQEQQ